MNGLQKMFPFCTPKFQSTRFLTFFDVYKFCFAGCNACYVGQTTRYFDTRVHEHLHKKTQPSSVHKHLEANVLCKEMCDASSFEIIDTDTSSFRLEVKEAIHNEWLKPSINKQKQLFKLSILIDSLYLSPMFGNGH